jgi:hypothetical protein
MNTKEIYNRLTRVIEGLSGKVPRTELFDLLDSYVDILIVEAADQNDKERRNEYYVAIKYLRRFRDQFFAPKKKAEKREFKDGAYTGEVAPGGASK